MEPIIAAPTPITGVQNPGGKPGLRRPLAVFQKEQKLAFSLYVQALLAWQQAGNEQVDQDNVTGTSYFQVTGIHGVPPVKWQNYPTNPFAEDVPQIIHACAKEIVNQATGSIKEAYAEALPDVRLPYWDWAFDSSLPDAIKTPDITISVPGDEPGTLIDLHLDHNPLWSYNSQASMLKKGYDGPLKAGSMTEVQASSFDPIFWLHHVNCDRLVALWQARQKEVTIRPFPSLLPRFNANAQTIEDGNSRLEPWHRDDPARGNPYWIADNVKGLFSTFSGGYHYPETPLEFIDNRTLMYAAATNAIEKLYRPGYLPPAPPISGESPPDGAPAEEIPPREPEEGENPVGAPPPSPPKGPVPTQTTKVWEAFVRVPEDADDWFFSENQVGVISLLSTLNRDSCVNCLSQSENDQLVTGTAPLSEVLHIRGIDDVQNIPIQDEFNLTVGVSSQDLRLPEAGSEAPSFGDSHTYPEITAGKPGGFDEGSQITMFTIATLNENKGHIMDSLRRYVLWLGNR
ncbi:Polyphenol oxidase 1 [Paramyrothecium foliicola]|nr:Polyphenol oxidase 1 [Paramyrothecium foliicola]